MKVIDLLNIWVTNRTKLPKKIKVGNKTFLYNEELNLYVTPDKQCYLIQNYLDYIGKLNKKVEVIEEKKEIEEKLDWEEIIGSVGKPVWDDKRKKWRVLDYYCREQNTFYVSFSDTNNREKFEEKELYFKEREEK